MEGAEFPPPLAPLGCVCRPSCGMCVQHPGGSGGSHCCQAVSPLQSLWKPAWHLGNLPALLNEGRSHPTICFTQTWQFLLHGFEAKPSILEQGWAGRSDHCWYFHIAVVWIISPAARSPCGIAFRGVPALLGSLMIFITSLQTWAVIPSEALPPCQATCIEKHHSLC